MLIKHHHRKRIGRIFYHTRKWTWFVSLALTIFLILAGGIAQYWLPKLISDKSRVEQYLSQISKQTITVGRLHTALDGIHPGIRATDIVIRDPKSDRGALRLKEVRLSLSYLSVLKGRPILNRLIVVEPELKVVRNADGHISVSGIRTGEKPATAAANESEKGSAAVDWLLAQGRIEIQNGRFRWQDRLHSATGILDLKHVNLALRNSGDRHKMTFSADFPADICKVCSFSLDIEGNPLVSGEWGGFVDVNAIGLNLRNRMTTLAQKFPSGLAGDIDLVLRSQWSQGRPRLAYGRVTAKDIDVPLGKFGKSLRINSLISSIRWRGRKNTWSMDMDLPFVRIDNEPWLPGQLKVTRYVGGTSVYLRHLNIKKAIAVAGRFNVPEKARGLIEKLKPNGYVDDLNVDIRDKVDGEDRFRVKADLRQLESLPYKKIPGVKGLNASVDTSETHGEIYLNSQRSEFNSTHVFRKPIPINRAKARITWQNKNNTLEINTQNIQLVGRDLSLKGGFVFRFPLDRKQSPQLDLRAEIFNGVVARISTYLPVNVMKPKLVAWLDKSVVSGKVADGHVIYRGKVREFPFIHDNGLFEVEANVEHGKLNYLPGWKPISSANMKLLFRGHSMMITGSSGRIDQLTINEIVAKKENLKDKSEPVKITGRVTGPVSNTLAVLRDAAAHGQKGGWTRFVESDIRANGNGQLSLAIEIPASPGHGHHLRGYYQFLGSNVVLPIGDIPAENLNGAVRFNEKGVIDGDIQAVALGGPVDIRLSGAKTARDPDTTFNISGRMTTQGLAKEYGQWIGKYFSGSIPWGGTVSFSKGIPNIALQGEMKAVRTSLPPPMRQLSNVDDLLMVESTSSSHRRQLLRVSLGSRFSGLLDYQSSGNKWKFTEGRLLVGEGMAALKGENGLFMEFRGDQLSAEDWVHIVHDSSGGEGIPMLVQGISGRFQEVDSLGRDWGRAEFQVSRRTRSQWSGNIDGDALHGKVILDTGPRGGRIGLDLDHLHIPQARQNEDKQDQSADEVDPRQFPTLNIASREFAVGAMNLGQLNFSAEHTRIGWEIKRLQMKRPDMNLFVEGTWFRVAGNHVTRTKMRFTSNNLGETLAALGNPGQVTGGTMTVDVDLDWRQDSKHRGLENLNGDITLNAKDGKFNKLDPGAAKGTGPFSLFALSRYLSLDFSPAFGKGLAFNNISGKIVIQQGDARTDGLTLNAPAAAVVARGHVGLHKRDLDINADIYPNLKGGVTVATGSIFGLQAAAWAYALQQLFSSEIEKGTRISYHITGTLDEPKVSKIVHNDGQKKK